MVITIDRQLTNGASKTGPTMVFINVDWITNGLCTGLFCWHANDDKGSLRHQIHCHFLAHDNGLNPVSIRTYGIEKEMKSNWNPLTLQMTDTVPRTFLDMYNAGGYKLDSQQIARMDIKCLLIRPLGFQPHIRTKNLRS